MPDRIQKLELLEFTSDARTAVDDALLHAARFNDGVPRIELLLVTLLRGDDTLAAQALRDLGVKKEDLEYELALDERQGYRFDGVDYRGVNYFDVAIENAQTEVMGTTLHEQRLPIDTGHLLIAIVKVPSGFVASYFHGLGIDYVKVRVALTNQRFARMVAASA